MQHANTTVLTIILLMNVIRLKDSWVSVQNETHFLWEVTHLSNFY